MCGWFRQVAARGREGGLGPGACLLPSHMQEDVTGQRKGPQRLRDGSALQGWGSPQGHPWPGKAVVLRKGGSPAPCGAWVMGICSKDSACLWREQAHRFYKGCFPCRILAST